MRTRHLYSHSGWFLGGLIWAALAYGQPQTTPVQANPLSASSAPVASAPVRALPLKPPVIEAASAILVDRETGEILFELNPDTERVPASTTKILTCLLALERGQPTDMVKVSVEATNTGGSRLHLSADEEIPLYELIEATMIRSGNDGAHALAEHVSGSLPAFLELMNITCAELGMHKSRFENPHGMPMKGGGNISTARDLAILARHAINNQSFRSIVQRTKVVYPQFGIRKDVEYTTTNRLLEEFPLTTGIKTGYTDLARHCLVASAQFRDREVIGVILGAEKGTIRRDMVRLFDYGLNQLAGDYWIYRKFSLEPQLYAFEEEPLTADALAAAMAF